MDSQKQKNAWRQVKYKERFINAFRGLFIFCKVTKHLFIYVLSVIAVIVLGFLFNISSIEWIVLVFAMGLVFITEILNTAIEIDIDLTSPDYHPFARDTKDVAAGAVLFSVVISVIIGLIIFLPKILCVI